MIMRFEIYPSQDKILLHNTSASTTNNSKLYLTKLQLSSIK